MEKVYDIHIHYLFEIPLEETVSTFQEEFLATGTEKYNFLSLASVIENGKVYRDELQNVKGLYLKYAFSPNAYAFAGLEHPSDHTDTEKVAENFLVQAKKYFSVGYDGIKMIEGYPTLIKEWNLPLDSAVYDKFYAYMEEKGYPIVLHLANPKENWDISNASKYAIQAGRVYDESYPTKEEITEQAFRVLKKYPKLRFILAHFAFTSYDIAIAERFTSYPNVVMDITPGGEQLINMSKEWDKWLPFWVKYQDRIVYGTDFYAFPKDENFEVAYQRRPKFIRQFFETDGEYIYLDEAFKGIKLDKCLRDKIYRENFLKLLGKPSEIDKEYLIQTAKNLQFVQNKRSKFADQDLAYILRTVK